MFIRGKGRDEYLTGELSPPPMNDPNARAWKVENNLVMFWLVNSMTTEIGENFLLYETAHDIWVVAREFYSTRDNTSAIFEVEQLDAFEEHAWSCPEDARRFRSIMEQKRIFKFLFGLNKYLDEDLNSGKTIGNASMDSGLYLLQPDNSSLRRQTHNVVFIHPTTDIQEDNINQKYQVWDVSTPPLTSRPLTIPEFSSNFSENSIKEFESEPVPTTITCTPPLTSLLLTIPESLSNFPETSIKESEPEPIPTTINKELRVYIRRNKTPVDKDFEPTTHCHESISVPSSKDISSNEFSGTISDTVTITNHDIELPIALRKGTRSCTRHPRQDYVSFNNLSLKYYSYCYHLFSENSYGWEVKSRVQSLNLLMGALCERNRSDLALQVLQEMNYQGCYPDRESYQVLMKGLCGDGRLHEATHLLYSMFWRVSQKGSGEDVVIYRILLDALCDNGKVEEALEILVKILRKGLKAPKRSYCRLDPSQFSNCKDTEGTKLLINEVLIRGIIPSLASYSAMAIDLYNEDRVIEGDMVLYKMRNRGFWPTPQIYEAKMAALCKDGKVEEALKVVDEERAKGYLAPNVRIYNILMKGLCDEGKSALAVEYLKKMAKQVGCVANKETYDILVNGLCSNGRFLDASRVLEEMLIKSYRPCLETYNVLIGGLCSVQRLYEAVMWVEEMVSQGLLPEICVWRSLVSSVCCNASDLDNCYETLNHPSSVS
ncbi:pentatricopeptide repeat-containing protein At1g05600-like [Carica papaya]|uniref:pentatricopeptide repeat-containing protein At1g05600-like n=1 Tax=Carica papaya TaxID=3649 RepID=UPI000B8CC07F|nr:pentatricopeptide repeat-containing protein At1g05600-like [Carica papaya]